MNNARTLAGRPNFKLFHTRGLTALVAWTTTLAAVAVTTFWTSRLIAPRPVAVLQVNRMPQAGNASEQDMARIFGVQAANDVSLGGIALTGVYAPTNGDSKYGFATFRTARGASGAAVGQEITPGLTLERVEPGRVIVASGGGRRTLELPTSKPSGPAPAPLAATAASKDEN